MILYNGTDSYVKIDELYDEYVSDFLMTDDMRRRAWPRLMKMEQVEAAPKPPLEVVKEHKEYQQVGILPSNGMGFHPAM